MEKPLETDPTDKAVAEFTAEIIELMKQASEEVGGPCTKLIESIRSKLPQAVVKYFSGRGLKRTSSGTIKTGTGLVIQDDDFTSDLSPIVSRPQLDLSKDEQDDSFDLNKNDILSDLLEDDGPRMKLTPNAKSAPIPIKMKKGPVKTPMQQGFVMPAPKKRSVQRSMHRTPDPGVELNLLDSRTDSIEISDYDSDDECGGEESLAPTWAKRDSVRKMVDQQEKIDPDTIFGRVTGGSMFDLAKIFEGWTPDPETKYNKRRTMSGNWTLDQLNLEEEEDYREKMQFLQPPEPTNLSFGNDEET